MQAAVRKVVESSTFEQTVGVLVVLNAVALGLDTDYKATHRDSEPTLISSITAKFFCAVFTVEWLMRVYSYGKRFFVVEGWRWHIFDTLMVFCQLLENLSINLSVLRLLRIVRVARLVRVLHLFDELRVIVTSIVHSASSLAWALLLLIILIYVFSVAFLQVVLEAGETEHADILQYYFSSLPRTFLTMFECIVNGMSWDQIVQPLMTDISPIMGFIFSIYIATCLFAMMNLLTGVFVDKAMRTVREDKDYVLATRIRDLFLGDAADENELHQEITWEDFSEKLECSAMQDYFKQINVEISEARSLFDLLDSDGGGTIDSKEIVSGCLRLRGPARALELYSLVRDMHFLTEKSEEAATRLAAMQEHMASLQRTIS